MTWDGMPENPGHDGFHWLRHDYTGEFLPFEWEADGERWVVDIDSEGYPEDMVNDGFTYHGPCALPVEIKNLMDQNDSLKLALPCIAEMPLREQDNMISGSMRDTALRALDDYEGV